MPALRPGGLAQCVPVALATGARELEREGLKGRHNRALAPEA
ncbi:hypothetical protein Enr13x_56080 [Stieleria neptunia]|uniref:Uncharacterized protein n=1 Tax=Stieleria neptunia TaxID=2527979 RepID=A0A518HXZ7_9BACT|nr:hypothetical protein Enr13x_56080 [Stieleria neptunia]